MRSRLFVILPAAALAAALTGDALFADLPAGPGDWPGWRGPARTGLSPEKGLLQSWPEKGPALAWKVTGLGHGYSTPSVAAGKLYVLGTKGKAEYVRCLALDGGKELWAAEVGTEKASYPGPRSTPTVDGDRLYAISSNGMLACVDLEGKVVWKKDLMRDFGGQHGNWAYAESPLIDGDKLVCTPGGDKASIVCLDKKTGKEVWRSGGWGLKKAAGGKGGKGGKGGGSYATAGYASAIVAETGGTRQYIQFVAGGVVGVDAKTGKLLWHYDEPGTGSNANCSAPIFHDDSVFAAASYGVGGGRAKIVHDGGFKAEQVYFVKQMANHHGGMVLVDGHVYGTNNSALLCIDFKTGDVKWTNRCVGKGSIVYADGHLICRGENGDVALVEASPAGYKEKGRFKQPERSDQKAWPHPVVAGGKLYLRDWDALLCYDLKGG